MPILDFPDNPTVGQVFTADTKSWTWTGTVWNTAGSSGGSGSGTGSNVIISDIAPTSPTEGTLWVNTTVAQLYVYYNDSWIGI